MPNGEISMSLEETNRLRADLGMAPLGAPAPAPGDKEAEAERLREELARRRQDRQQQKQQHQAGEGAPPKARSLGESLIASGPQSAAAWVQKSQGEFTKALQSEAEAGAAAERKKQAELGSRYDSEDLAGLKVAHAGLGDLEEGEQVVLTLRDSSILAEGDLNAEEDELENVEMAEGEKVRSNNEIRSRKPLYDVFGEDPNQETELLGKYSERKRQASVRLGELHASAASQAGRDEEGRQVFSLDSERKIMGEFKAAKPVKFKQKKAGKRERRGEAARPGKSLLDEIFPEPEQDLRQEDHSSREVSLANLRLKQEDERRKALADQSYLQALRQAELQRLGGHAVRVDTSLDAADDDPLLHSSLERARQANLRRQRLSGQGGASVKLEGSAGGGPEDPAARIRRQMELLEQRKKEQAVKQEPRDSEDGPEMQDDGEEPVKREAEAEGAELQEVLLTDTNEFCQALESTLDELRQQRERRRRLRERAASVKQEDGTVKQESSSSNWRNQMRDEDASSDEDEEKQVSSSGGVKQEGPGAASGEEEEEEEEDLFSMEPVVGDGLGSVLALVRQRGLLQGEQSQFGRAKDKALALADDPAPHLKIGVYDEGGRLLKPKEAFRYISHAFHGHKPGAKKREKRLKDIQAEADRMADTGVSIGFAGMRRPRDVADEDDPEPKRRR